MKERIFVFCSLTAAFILTGLLSPSNSIADPQKVWGPEDELRNKIVLPLVCNIPINQ